MIERFANKLFPKRRAVMFAIAIASAILGLISLRMEIATHFADLLPGHHPYVEIHEAYKGSFGGANVVTIMVEPETGDIFQPKVLNKIRDLTQGVLYLDAVNQYQISFPGPLRNLRMYAARPMASRAFP